MKFPSGGFSAKRLPHESADAHVTGAALYTDELIARFPGTLHAWPVVAPHAHALLTHIDLDAGAGNPRRGNDTCGVGCPGEGDSGANKHDEPLFPIEITYHSQPVAWVLVETLEAARLGAASVIANSVRSPRF